MMPYPPTIGLVVAGGLARRMGGGDKALIEIGGVTILARVLTRLRPQCAGLLLNANGDATRFTQFGVPVVADSVPDFAGPLAGLLSGLDDVASHHPHIEWVVSAPGDCPFLPRDLVPRLHEARIAKGTRLACASSGEWRHPLAGLWAVALREDLRRALADGTRRIEAWTARHGIAMARWDDRPVDPFFNVNAPQDRAKAETIARDYPDA